MKPFTIATACLTLMGSAWAGESISESAPMDSGKRLEVYNKAGSIEITGWSRNRIEVTGDLSGSSELEFVTDKDRVLVKVVGRRHNKHGSADLEISVPKETHIKVSGVSTDIEIEAITGQQQVNTVSGDIVTQAYDDEVYAKTVSGEVDVEGHGKESVLEVTTVSGDADIENASGDITVGTVSGEIDVTGNGMTRLDMSTVSGDIEFEGQLDKSARVDVETVNGDVLLEIQDDIPADFDLESFNGSISSIDGHAAKRQSKYGPGRYLEYTRGKGTARIRVNTLNGDIDIGED